MEEEEWKKLIEYAKEVLNPREISSSVSAGSVAAAVLSKSGNIYTGVCIDTACSIGMCAERNALSNMITCNESEIKKLVCINSKNNIKMPCGVCREFMMQMNVNNKNTTILVDMDSYKSITLDELLPNWWN